MISDAQGEKLVRLARKALETYLSQLTIITADDSSQFPEHSGVFVTLNYLTRKGEEHLRGCIGFPISDKELHKSIVEAAIAAATEDPRFPPVDKQELPNIALEVSVLTPPEEIEVNNHAEYKNQIKIGRDGLVLKWKYGSGLLLPQVPAELGWDVEEYLANICYKAGAPPDAWLDPESKLYRFEATVFKELSPNGKVVRVNLSP